MCVVYLQVNSMLNYLEACHYKISCAQCTLENRNAPMSKYSQYIEKTRDKQVSKIHLRL